MFRCVFCTPVLLQIISEKWVEFLKSFIKLYNAQFERLYKRLKNKRKGGGGKNMELPVFKGKQKLTCAACTVAGFVLNPAMVAFPVCFPIQVAIVT